MKIIKYVLNLNGTTPDHIIYGGYFPVLNNNPSPQDYDLIGITSNDLLEGFIDKQSLLEYAQENNASYIYDVPLKTVPLEQIVDDIWSKLNG